MPRPRKQSALEQHVSSLAVQFGSALVQAVRAELAAEVARLNGKPRARAAVAKSGRLRRGSVNEAVLGKLLAAIKRQPGLRAEQIYAKVSLSKRLAKAGLAKLREKKQVRITGQKRAATYRA